MDHASLGLAIGLGWGGMGHGWRHLGKADFAVAGIGKDTVTMRWDKWTSWALVLTVAIGVILVALLKVNNWKVWAALIGLALVSVFLPMVGFGIAALVLIYLLLTHASTLPQQIASAWSRQVRRWNGHKKGAA